MRDRANCAGQRAVRIGLTAPNAAEQFIVAPRTSALVFAGAGDTVDLSGAIEGYSFAKSGTQAQISDGTYTTTLSVGGSFTLRTASGSTSVAIDYAAGGAIKLGGSQIVGSGSFNPLAAITDANNLSSNAAIRLVDSTSGELTVHGAGITAMMLEGAPLADQLPPQQLIDGHAYTANDNQIDTFIIDAAQPLAASITGFAPGDVLQIQALVAGTNVEIVQGQVGDGIAVLHAGSATVTLDSLPIDTFTDMPSFVAAYGSPAVGYLF